MRYRLELQTCDGFVYCSVSRSFGSSWLAAQRQMKRDPACELRILESPNEGLTIDQSSWVVIAEICRGEMVTWHGQAMDSRPEREPADQLHV